MALIAAPPMAAQQPSFHFAVSGSDATASGIWRVSFNANSGVLGAASRVYAINSLGGLRSYGRHVYFWTSSRLYAYRLDNPGGAWSGANVQDLGSVTLFSPARPTFAGASVFVPQRDSLRLGELSFDASSHRATSVATIAQVPTSYSSDVIVAGDRVYVVNYNRGFQLYRLR